MESLYTDTISDRAKGILAKLHKFVHEECIPGDEIAWQQQQDLRAAGKPWAVPPIVEDLKLKAKALGLWNLFLPKEYPEGKSGR